jgi:hypothetical protein
MALLSRISNDSRIKSLLLLVCGSDGMVLGTGIGIEVFANGIGKYRRPRKDQGFSSTLPPHGPVVYSVRSGKSNLGRKCNHFFDHVQRRKNGVVVLQTVVEPSTKECHRDGLDELRYSRRLSHR